MSLELILELLVEVGIVLIHVELILNVNIEHVRKRWKHTLGPLIFGLHDFLALFLNNSIEYGVIRHSLNHLSALLVPEGEI